MPMHFCFYPRHEYACAHVSDCPHLGGAALGLVVEAANGNGDYLDMLHGQLAAARQSMSEMSVEIGSLRKELEQVKLELRLERQNKFRTRCDEQETDEPTAVEDPAGESTPANAEPRKRGAPVGHPGWFRATPTEFHQTIEVAAPERCPHCDGQVRCLPHAEPDEHVQEDVVQNVYQVVCYRHAVARCQRCRRFVQQAGPGEILRSHIGPQLRAWALFLRNDIGISYRKVPRTLCELFNFPFTPAAVIGFEKLAARPAQLMTDDIGQKIASSEGAVHADETYWMLDGQRAYYWVHGDEKFIHFQFDTSRAGQVSRDVLGEHFAGTLVTDCYSGYHAHAAQAKQKCLVHVARRAREWQKLTQRGSSAWQFFQDLKQFAQRGCAFHRNRQDGKLTAAEQRAEKTWLRNELARLEVCAVDHPKAITLQKRLVRHHDEWLVFLDDPRVPPTNNLAERALRPLVVLRKTTFGHRTQAGAERMAALMTVQETAKRHGHKATDIYYRLLTQPPERVLKYLYAGGKSKP
jgi:hypothetical protein